MELWIRSQDREMLYKTNELFLDFEICEELGINEYYVNVNHETFGKYKTKERVLEILDEIQQTIKQQEFVKLTFSKIPPEQYDNNEEKIDKMFSYFVYEMPKE